MRGPRGLDLANPVTVYTLLWTSVLALTALQLTTQLVPLNRTTVLLVAANIATFLALYVILGAWMPAGARGASPVALGDSAVLQRLRRLITALLAVWAVGSIAEAILAGGFPLVWIATGQTDKDYRNFGLPTLHGLLTAFYLFSVAGLFLDYCVSRRRAMLIGVGILLTWPVLLMNRGALIWALLEIAAVYLLLTRIDGRRILWLSAAGLVAVLMFGYIGDVRVGPDHAFLYRMLTPSGQRYLSSLPSGFVWVYMYLTSPVNNLVAGIETLKPNHVLYYSVANLVPTVLRVRLYPAGAARYPMQLVDRGFTASTWYAGFLSDVGIAGAIVIVSFIQLIAVWVYMHARRRELWAILAYAAVFEGVALSIFADTFTSLVTVAQIAIAIAFWMTTRDVPAASAS
jgi:oligosaccharide repeat unit polymerase